MRNQSEVYITKIDKKVKQSIGIVSFQNEGHRASFRSQQKRPAL